MTRSRVGATQKACVELSIPPLNLGLLHQFLELRNKPTPWFGHSTPPSQERAYSVRRLLSRAILTSWATESVDSFSIRRTNTVLTCRHQHHM
jgi:hypothetical protein